MDSSPFIFLSIFGFLLILSAYWIFVSNDPKKLPFFTSINPITHMSLYDSKQEAKIISKYVFLIGLIILIISFIGMFL
jgi:hypothetical protein